jgi:hypothetical protein
VRSPGQWPVGGQGVGLAAAATEGQHQLRPATLPQRFRGHRRFQVADQGGVLTQAQAGLNQRLLRAPAQLGQPRPLGHSDRLASQLDQRLAPP